MIKRKKIATLLLSAAVVQAGLAQVVVTGTVQDESQMPLMGVSVQLKNGTTRTTSDVNGQFRIEVPTAKSTLHFTYLGMKSVDVAADTARAMSVVMKETETELNEAVVVAFGTQKKINATGSVKTINADKVLNGRPISDAVSGLQGTIAGLNITNDAGGALGQSMEINIRGIGTVGDASSGSPLVLIDGMEGDLSMINPSDIASVSVLKDAASASVYGSRAPFGVILVTTKEGKKGATRVKYKGNIRLSQPISVPDQVDSYTYALMVNDAFINSGGSAQFSTTQLEKILAYQRGELQYGIQQVEGQNDWTWNQRSFGNTNWYDTFLKNVTVAHEHNVSISGAGDKVNYYFSANYLNRTGLFNYADERFQRMTLNGKISVTFNKYVKMTWNSRILATENEKPTAMNSLFYHNLGRRSPLSPIYMPNGEYNKESLIPALQDGGQNISKNRQFHNQLTLVFEPLKDWHINLEVNSRIETPTSTRQFKKLSYALPDGTREDLAVFEGVASKFEARSNGTFNIQPTAGTSAYEKFNNKVNYINSNLYTDYAHTWGNHYLKALLGMQLERNYYENNGVATNDILLDDRPFISSTASQILVSEKKGTWTAAGVFARLNYVYANRYMAEFNIRRDGASRFPKEKRWAWFPSVSVGWNIAEENFWSKIKEKGFEYLKLRSSYGTLGNQNTTSYYPYYQQMKSQTGSLVIGGEQANVLPVYSPYTSNLTWEKVVNAGIGLDWGFFRNRLTGSFDWYQRTTKNMLGPSVSLAAVYGGSAPKTNTAELRTRGWEIELAWRDVIGKDWSYGISATLSDYNTVITKYDSPDGNLNNWYSGKKYGTIWGYQVVGIAKSDAEMEAYLAEHSQAQIGSNWGGGDLMYRDIDNNGSVDPGSNTIDNHGDLTVIGNSTPRFAYSFTLEARWKWIDLRAFFQGIGKRDLYFKNSATFFGFGGYPYQRSLYMDHLDYFRYAGSELGANYENPYYGRLRTDQNNIQVCDRFLQNGAYLRLKNLQIGFNLPQGTKLGKWVKDARLYFSAENLFTFTKLRIYDPEAVGSNSDDYGAGKTYPMYRVYSIGLELTF